MSRSETLEQCRRALEERVSPGQTEDVFAHRYLLVEDFKEPSIGGVSSLGEFSFEVLGILRNPGDSQQDEMVEWKRRQTP